MRCITLWRHTLWCLHKLLLWLHLRLSTLWWHLVHLLIGLHHYRLSYHLWLSRLHHHWLARDHLLLRIRLVHLLLWRLTHHNRLSQLLLRRWLHHRLSHHLLLRWWLLVHRLRLSRSNLNTTWILDNSIRILHSLLIGRWSCNRLANWWLIKENSRWITRIDQSKLLLELLR